MNKFQSRPVHKMIARRLPVGELRPGSTLTLGHNSARTRKLPQTVGQCIGGSYATVTEVTPFGDSIRVVVSQGVGGRARRLIFIVPGSQNVIARMPDVTPVPFTPLGWAVMLGLPGAAEVAKGTSYAAA